MSSSLYLALLALTLASTSLNTWQLFQLHRKTPPAISLKTALAGTVVCKRAVDNSTQSEVTVQTTGLEEIDLHSLARNEPVTKDGFAYTFGGCSLLN